MQEFRLFEAEMLRPGLFLDYSHFSADDFNLAIINEAMDRGFDPVPDAFELFHLLKAEAEDAYQILHDISEEAISWLNDYAVPEGYALSFHPEESNVLVVWKVEEWQ